MKVDNPFDQHLSANKDLPTDVREAAVFVTDTLDIAWKSAQTVFGTGATATIALAIYDRIAARIESPGD